MQFGFLTNMERQRGVSCVGLTWKHVGHLESLGIDVEIGTRRRVHSIHQVYSEAYNVFKRLRPDPQSSLRMCIVFLNRLFYCALVVRFIYIAPFQTQRQLKVLYILTNT